MVFLHFSRGKHVIFYSSTDGNCKNLQTQTIGTVKYPQKTQLFWLLKQLKGNCKLNVLLLKQLSVSPKTTV